MTIGSGAKPRRDLAVLLSAATMLLATLIALIASGPAHAAVFEPNEGANQATGPLAGGALYSAAIETPDDQDWFYFYTSRLQQLDLSVSSTSSDGDCAIQAEVLDPELKRPAHFTILDQNESYHFLWTSPGPALYYLKVADYEYGGCPYGVANSYSFRVDPADAITSVPPPPPPTTPSPPTSPAPTRISSDCKAATAQVARLRGLLRDADGRKRKAKLRRRLRVARNAVNRSC